MVSIVSKELHFDEELKKKIEFICDFCNTKPTIINGYIKRTNLSYIEPHRVTATYNRRYQLSNYYVKWNCKFNTKFKSKGEK